MFDADTAKLIRAAPVVSEVNPELLPQELTRVYAELVALRLREREPSTNSDLLDRITSLGRVAAIYEGAVDTGAEGEQRRAAAFVSATAHGLLGQAFFDFYGRGLPLLGSGSIHPFVAAPLLFLIAEQNPDAREAARQLHKERETDPIRTALIETIEDLATERFENILERAERLSRLSATYRDTAPEFTATQVLYGLCWTGVVRLVGNVLDRPVPEMAYLASETPRATFDRVVALAVKEVPLPVDGGQLLSTYSGPRHLARLLRHVAGSLEPSGVVRLPTPSGSNEELWSNWLRKRARTKPVLWRNHRNVLGSNFLEIGKSSVLVLPTGAGKTTLSEFKIAATLASGREVLFLVPTLALVDQLSDDLAESFPSLGSEVGISTDGDLTALVSGLALRDIEVMTPEYCLALLSHSPDAIANVGLVVFDECHLLSPAGGGKRSLDAMLCSLQVLKRAPAADLLLLSAMLTNPAELAAWLQETTGRPCSAYQDSWKPARQARGVLIYRRRDISRIRNAILSAQRKRGPVSPLEAPHPKSLRA
jgi:DEAD/DEAH box helicase